MPLPLVITPGDPLGVGPEVVAGALKALSLDAVIVGDAAAVERWTGPLPRAGRIGPLRGVALLEPAGDEPVEVAAIRAGVAACLEGRARALVTGPINKHRLAARGFKHPGHTDFLGELCGVERPVMAFAGGEVRVALVTVHLPLSAVPGALSRDLVAHTARVAHAALRDQLHIPAPRLLVCGLNPHAGDGGLLGREEIEIIAPACALLRAEGVDAAGPMSAEAAFVKARAGGGDMVVAMYHDQGLAPLKALDFGRSVNWTLGLPILRTSVDHGTAEDIAGQGVADPGSMIAALEFAALATLAVRSASPRL
jgi:4-hydroxythreonine-4-phosphate dehydrogenase